MNTTTHTQAAQERMAQWIQAMAADPALGLLASPEDLQRYLQAGFGVLLNAALSKERELHLEQHPADRGNGFAPTRELHVKTVPVQVTRPRTREGFYPAFLPRYQHHVPADYQEFLEQILLGAKSFRSALQTMQQLGMSYSPKELEALLSELEQEAKTFHSRPLDPDWLVLYIDAKVIDLKNEHDQVKKAVHFLVIGINMEGRKEMLSSQIIWGNETVDCWRQVLVELKNRGVTRPLLLVTDDFSGLTKLVAGFWPHTDHQLCTVHLLRNAQRQLRPADYSRFREAWQEIKAASSPDTARAKWLALLESLRPAYPAWVDYLQTRTDHYLRFMNYPGAVRRNVHSTNLPEGINNLIETLRRNAGGHFHSLREATIKMKLVADQLARRRWRKPNPMIKFHLPDLLRIFQQRFEAELPPNHFLTQNF